VLLVRTGAGYSVDCGGRLDAERFESFLDQAGGALAGEDPDAAVSLLQQALALWHGPAFGDHASDVLVAPEAARLEELRLVACEQKVEAEIGLGEHRRVIGELEALCEAHPLRERLWELRMLALARSGRQAEALRAYQRARRVLVDELGIEPSNRLQRMEQSVLAHDPSLEATSPPPEGAAGRGPPRLTPALPPDATAFIGRVDEIVRISELLGRTRLLTLTGIGGVGKTRLAIQVARRAAPSHPGGVVMVDLSGVSDPEEAEATFSGSIDGLGSPELERLVILDNCEHLIETCARVVEGALGSQPSLRVLATSREPLGVPGETRWTVEPLAVPDEDAPEVELAANDAAQLFVQRGRAARPAVDFDHTAMQEVAQICRQVDGIPLAIELAAALMATMSLREIRDGLAARFELLREGYRTAPERQQTLMGAFDWSYALLDDRDKLLLQRLHPFELEFRGRAAEIVCAADQTEEPAIRRGLGRLVDRSLVQMHERDGHATYGILPTIQQFVFERTGWQRAFELRTFVVLLARHTEPRLRGTLDDMWSALLDGPSDVCRAALDLAFELHDLEAGAFLAGVAAARTTRSGRVAVVGGVRMARGPVHLEAGFRAGVHHADDGVDVEALYVSEPPDFTGFKDIEGARRLTTAAYRLGVDVVFHAAGPVAGHGVLEATRNWHEATGAFNWVIGVDLDERVTREPRLRPYVLTSMRRQIPSAVYQAVKAAVAAGEPDAAPRFDLANEGVGLSRTGGQIDRLEQELEAVRTDIVAGRIDVPRVLIADGAAWWDAPPEPPIVG
jgi:predicted ATPase